MTTTSPDPVATSAPAVGKQPLFDGERGIGGHIGVYIFVLLPAIAVLVTIPFAWGWGVSWLDLGLAAFMFTVTTLGVTVGFHRYFTHGSFKAKRWLRIALAVVGSMSVQGPIMHWVADHRRHHAFSDREGDPHSPWNFGTSPQAIMRGFWHAHMGWVFERDLSNPRRFAPDLLADNDIRVVNKLFGVLTAVTLLLPALIGGLVTWSIWGAVTAFFWGSVVRVFAGHHVAWSTNSVCHMLGERPFKSRDKSANFWPLAILSMGEAWHNLHHADPTCARHGVGRGQIDISARVIWVFEKLGWASNVRWPTQRRLSRLRAE